MALDKVVEEYLKCGEFHEGFASVRCSNDERRLLPQSQNKLCSGLPPRIRGVCGMVRDWGVRPRRSPPNRFNVLQRAVDYSAHL